MLSEQIFSSVKFRHFVTGRELGLVAYSGSNCLTSSLVLVLPELFDWTSLLNTGLLFHLSLNLPFKTPLYLAFIERHLLLRNISILHSSGLPPAAIGPLRRWDKWPYTQKQFQSSRQEWNTSNIYYTYYMLYILYIIARLSFSILVRAYIVDKQLQRFVVL